jgi:tetratricopeptide (TPR) repeat protein
MMHQCGGSNAVYTDRMNGTRYSWQAIILVFACWCPILSTRYAYPQTDPPQHINGVQTILSGEIELPRLVDLCAQRLNLNIEYDVNALRGTVTLRLGRGVTDAELWTLTNRLLVTRGFVSVRGPGESLLSIVKLNEAPSKALLRDALAADLYYGPAHNNLGVLYLQRGELYEAAHEFEWARKLMPGHPDPRMNLALTLETAGRIDDALETYATALEVYPDHTPTIQAITRCQLRHARLDERTAQWLDHIALNGETETWRDWAQLQLTKHEPSSGIR